MTRNRFSPGKNATIVAGVLGVLALLAPSVTRGQALGAQVGISSYDLNGLGTGLVGGPFRRYPIGQPVSLTVALPLFTDAQTSTVLGQRVSQTAFLFLPEASVEVGKPLAGVRPFAGVGAGAAISLGGPQPGGLTLHALLGAAVRVGDRTSLVAAAKVRSVRPWAGSMVDLTLGIERGRPAP